MAKIKFALKMPDGAEARTLEQLREHFDLVAILNYYSSGRLYDWLDSRGYDEAEKLKALNPSSESFQQDLYEVLGVPHPEMENSDLSLSDIAARNGRLERLKQYTVDNAILAVVDRVAFTQEELDDLVSKSSFTSGVSSVRSSKFTTSTVCCSSTLAGSSSVGSRTVIYLCGECFTIPGDVGGITFVGINSPTIEFVGESVAAGIDLQGIRFDLDGYIDDYIDGHREGKRFFDFFADNLTLGIKLLCVAAEDGPARLQTFLGCCYENGHGIEADAKRAMNWYQKAADKGYKNAENIVGNAYKSGFAVQQDFSVAAKWYRKAAEQDLPEAQNSLGLCYRNGDGVEQSYVEANKWFLRAAESGYHWAQYNLGTSYRDGKGVSQNRKDAVRWFQKSVAQGNKTAKTALLELEPTMFKLSDVILYAVGDVANLNLGTRVNREANELEIFVDDRNKVNTMILRAFGASSIEIEPIYFTYKKEMYTVKQTLKEIGGFFKNNLKTFLTDAPPDLNFTPPQGIETVKEDLGCGCIHIGMSEISPCIEEDFNQNVVSNCSESTAVALRKLEVVAKALKERVQVFFDDL